MIDKLLQKCGDKLSSLYAPSHLTQNKWVAIGHSDNVKKNYAQGDTPREALEKFLELI